MMIRAIIYIRVSTDEQAESGLGLEAQLSACRAYAARMALEVVLIFEDSMSAGLKLDRRTVLLQAIGAMQKGDVLLVAKRDRLTRGDVFAGAMIEAAVKRHRGRIVSAAGEGTEADDPSNILMRRLIDAFSEYERAVIGARTKSALTAKRARGERTGGVPYGRRLTGEGPLAKRSKLPTGLAPVPAEAEALDLVAELRLAGHSLRAIADEMNRRSIPTKAGRPWHFGTVRRIVEKRRGQA
jgi:DNA invertase Pin-like site-specific DNA recombinase